VKARFLIFLFAMFLAVPTFAASASRPQSPVKALAVNSFPAPLPRYLAEIIKDASREYGVDPNLIAAMAYKESRFRPTAVSSRGAQGIMQLMPRTAKSLGVTDSFDVRQNVFGGTKYMKKMLERFNGDLEMSLAAYNAGPERVAKEGPRATNEAIDYVAAIKAYYRVATRAV
jgi:soluble lytic murein transglycosylase-like protein